MLRREVRDEAEFQDVHLRWTHLCWRSSRLVCALLRILPAWRRARVAWKWALPERSAGIIIYIASRPFTYSLLQVSRL